MYYIFGDIHGCFDRLFELFGKVKETLNNDDVLIFLGDYIDRGKYSFEVIEYLLHIAGKQNRTYFIRGNHEAMLADYLAGRDTSSNYINNGGDVTKMSYRRHFGDFTIPAAHLEFFSSCLDYYEGEDFIAVHAGLDPRVGPLESQNRDDLVWIREKFYKSRHRWDKTVIFGHTPTHQLHGKLGQVYWDEERNIIGIDTGAVYGGKLTCLVWPGKRVFQS